MRVGVPKETAERERRVALVPEVVRKLTQKEYEVIVEAGAGQGAMIPDALFEDAGAKIADTAAVWGADVVVKVAPPSAEESARLSSDGVLIGFLAPLTAPDTVRALAQSGATAFALEAVPRISRAQSMDALSSQSNVAGYRAALLGAQLLGRFYPMLMTAAGTVRPAKVLVLGAGVAGLQAIATARRLGAAVTGYDVRSAVAEQVKSLGADFLELEAGKGAEGEGGYARELTDEEKAAQQQELTDAIAEFDVVITTALVPGRPAPKLVTADAVERMKPGAVDGRPGGRGGRQLRALRAGRDGGQARRHDRRAAQRAQHDGRARLPALRAQHPVAARADDRRGRRAEPRLRRRDHRRGLRHPRRRDRPRGRQAGRGGRRLMLVTNLAILVLAGFVGFVVISKVPNTLHTPLMSGTNAIHGIVILGGLIVLGLSGEGTLNKILLVIAITFGTINVVGGFLVTDRMLEMFKSKPEPAPEKETDE